MRHTVIEVYMGTDGYCIPHAINDPLAKLCPTIEHKVLLYNIFRKSMHSCPGTSSITLILKVTVDTCFSVRFAASIL